MSSTKIKTGICSYGMSGKLFHAPFIANHPGFELTAIVERHKDESSRRYPDAKRFRSFEALIADPVIELIIVNTPVQTHFEYVKAALEAGKDVVVEKPFTVTVTEAEELDRLAKERNRFLSVYQNRRYDGDYRQVKQVVTQGMLGELKEVEIRYDRYRTGYSGKEHKEGALPGAGIVHDLGAHMIDQSLQLFGWPDAVFADIRILREKEVQANDYFEILLYYPSLRVRLKSTVIARKTTAAYILHGVRGSFLQDRSDVQEEQLLKETEPSIENWCPPLSAPDGWLFTDFEGREINEATTSLPGNYMNYYDDVYHALSGRQSNPVPASDAVKSMRIIEAAFESSNNRCVVTIQPL